jgi:hypothetical protein
MSEEFQPIDKNWADGDGNHQGGISTGIGYTIAWQRGALNVEGRNGAFVIEVLESVRWQLEYMNEGKYECQENTEAIEHLNGALAQLRTRRDRRKNAGTLGTHLTDSQPNKIPAPTPDKAVARCFDLDVGN